MLQTKLKKEKQVIILQFRNLKYILDADECVLFTTLYNFLNTMLDTLKLGSKNLNQRQSRLLKIVRMLMDIFKDCPFTLTGQNTTSNKTFSIICAFVKYCNNLSIIYKKNIFKILKGFIYNKV